MNIFTVKNFQTAFFVALGAGLYIGFVDRLIPSQLSLPVRNNGVIVNVSWYNTI